MGCDIHVFIEQKQSQWSPLAEVNVYRNYALFAQMSDVRNYEEITPLFPARGWLADMSYQAKTAATYWVTEEPTEEREISKEDAAKWVAQKWTTYHSESRVYGPDWHSASWLTTKELRQVLEAHKAKSPDRDAPQMWATLAMMEETERRGAECRVVFWFDN